MEYIILDLGSDVNIITRNIWESMGESRLVWSYVQLILGNQLKVLPIYQLTQVFVETERLKTYVDFEVIDIVNDTNMYPICLGINWEIDYNTTIKSKKMILMF